MGQTISEDALIPQGHAETIIRAESFANPELLHDTFRWLRANQPLGIAAARDYRPFWVVTRHADILEIERQPDIFRNGDLSTTIVSQPTLDAIETVTGSPHLVRSLVSMDGAEHRLYRSLTQSWFMPGNVKKLSDRIRRIARARVDHMMTLGGECDFVSDVALHYPLHVIMEILGVPEHDEPRMLMLTQQLFGARDPDHGRAHGSMVDPMATLGVFQSVIRDFHDYFSELSASRRASPRDDVATVIANAVVDGCPIGEREANSYYILVATAGHDTTSASTAGAIWALAERPAELARIKRDPALMDGLVDEAIRWVTPVKHFMRSAVRDYDLNGRTIRAGDWLMLSYMSANRDEAVFEYPFEFRSDRIPNRQLSFGYGPHVCLGQHLARLEMKILFEELLPRLGSIELAAPPSWTQSTFVSGPKRLPIRFTPA